MIRLEFIRSYTLNGRKQVMGQKISAWPTLAERLLSEGAVRPHTGTMKSKIKTDFFKPK